MTSYPNIAARIYDTPLAVMPQKAEIILNAIAPRLAGKGDDRPAAFIFDDETDERPLYASAGGIAVITVHGTLVQRHSGMNALSGLTSYEELSQAFDAAMNDSAADGIFMDIDSPGGEVSGLFDFVDSAMERIGSKPVHAHINELSASAAFAITTIADHVSVPRTGTVSSVGVIVIHQEITKMLGKAGVKVNIIRAGKRKAETNPFEELSEVAGNALQAEVDRIREIFVTTVAQNRGLEEQVVWDTEAAVLNGPEALKIGLVDAVMSSKQAANHLVNTLG